jgi:hypothetical protein
MEYILECSYAFYNCNGGNMNYAMDLAIKAGVPTSTMYPYTAGSYTSGRPTTTGICNADVF